MKNFLLVLVFSIVALASSAQPCPYAAFNDIKFPIICDSFYPDNTAVGYTFDASVATYCTGFSGCSLISILPMSWDFDGDGVTRTSLDLSNMTCNTPGTHGISNYSDNTDCTSFNFYCVLGTKQAVNVGVDDVVLYFDYDSDGIISDGTEFEALPPSYEPHHTWELDKKNSSGAWVQYSGYYTAEMQSANGDLTSRYPISLTEGCYRVSSDLYVGNSSLVTSTFEIQDETQTVVHLSGELSNKEFSVWEGEFLVQGAFGPGWAYPDLDASEVTSTSIPAGQNHQINIKLKSHHLATKVLLYSVNGFSQTLIKSWRPSSNGQCGDSNIYSHTVSNPPGNQSYLVKVMRGASEVLAEFPLSYVASPLMPGGTVKDESIMFKTGQGNAVKKTKVPNAFGND